MAYKRFFTFIITLFFLNGCSAIVEEIGTPPESLKYGAEREKVIEDCGHPIKTVYIEQRSKENFHCDFLLPDTEMAVESAVHFK